MRHTIFALAAFLIFATRVDAQNRKLSVHAVCFYNLENLFDTTHDKDKIDYDFLPDGSYHWDENKYTNKLNNMARTLCDLGTDKVPYGASIVGVVEVENDHALDDLMAVPCMKQRGYKYIHYEGPDKRGVDCALIYNPKAFKVEKSFHKLYVFEHGDTAQKTRPFLCVQGKLAGDNLTILVCHLPSRGHDNIYREDGARQARAITDSIRQADPSQHIMVMGDMNDDPDNTSMAKFLGARRKMKDVGEGDFFNPWWDILRNKGQGTLAYQGGWNLFDQIVCSRNMLDLKDTKEYKELTLYGYHIFKRDYLLQQEGKYKGTPKRTHAGGVWLNGFSDHLPTVTYIVKEVP